jgi:hypothetical protein
MSKIFTKQWLIADGMIQASTLELIKLGNDEISCPVYGYRLRVQYRYQVNGKEYVRVENFHYSLSIEGDRQAIRQARDCYSVGAEGIIYYNPCNPEESTLYRLFG